MIIGITGYIGTGKTTIVQWFEQAGFTKLDVDAISHELLKDQEIRTKITATFGESILDRRMQIDRKKLSSLVFNNPQQLHRLNNMVHQKLRQSILNVLKEMKKKHNNIIIDVALLEELGLVPYVDKVIIVKASLELLYRRLAPRYTQREVLTAINNQKIPSHADSIIENNGSLEELEQKVQQVIRDIL
ncbi:dephospho-CoA kinase [Candidatus Woesearchaeota archaeon]|nr:dephospho-CoA kinase [Candidatus Woesearchaeota archaeon]